LIGRRNIVEFADRLDRLLEFLIIGQPAARLGHPLAAADLVRAVASEELVLRNVENLHWAILREIGRFSDGEWDA
jgi:hypothetical protein